ncbi:MAG: DUF4139 domain-containing protein [Chitinophagaceae bacterium]|nr:DUF4139 domain-containing protein [Chitinophagaceae bacterium]
MNHFKLCLLQGTALLTCLASLNVVAQPVKEKELKTAIQEVTVFFKGAQIFENGTVAIPAGKTLLQVKNLSPFLDEKSLQVKATGQFTILGINHRLNYLQKLKRDTKIDSLNKILEVITEHIARENARMQVLKEKMSLLNENKKLAGQSASVTMLQLKQAIDFFETEVSAIKEEELKINKSIERQKDEQTDLSNQITELNRQQALPASEVEILVMAEQAVTGQFQLSYLVANAGWFPRYDVRVENIKQPIELTYKAEVYQNTGVDWKQVKLRFSNADPNKSGVLPILNTWNLNYARNTIVERITFGLSGNVKGVVTDENGLPLAGVTVMVKGSTVATATDSRGRYSITLPNKASQLVFSYVGMNTAEMAINKPEINVRLTTSSQSLSEVIVTGYASGLQVSDAYENYNEKKKAEPITTMVVENQTTVEMEVEIPYSLASNGEKIQVELKTFQVNASYEYYAIPKLDKDAFLVARITDWDKYNLLEGEANLYFEDAYVGRTILDAKALQDTLDISLGRDKSLVLGREKVEEFSKTKTIGSNTVDTRAFKIVVRNKKSQPVKITLFDQLPVSVVNDITVSAIELSKAVLEEKTGRVTWEISLDPQQQKELILQYEVKYPRKERVILE